jgi:hypothetical protein
MWEYRHGSDQAPAHNPSWVIDLDSMASSRHHGVLPTYFYEEYRTYPDGFAICARLTILVIRDIGAAEVESL